MSDANVIDMQASIDYAWRSKSVGIIVANAMNWMKRKHQNAINTLIEENIALGSTIYLVRIRDKVFEHSERSTPQVRGKPRISPALHLDLFDKGQKLYLAHSKLDHERRQMEQMLNLMTSSAKTVQEFRDAILPSLESHARPITDQPRVVSDPFHLVTCSRIRAQLESMKGLFAVYAMAELMGQ